MDHRLTHKIIEAREILQSALDEHDPQHTYLLYSGGDDSIVSTHLSARFIPDATVAHIDTGIKFPKVTDHVRDTAARHGWALRIIKNDDHRGKSWEQWCMENGMPGGASHPYLYQQLKERALEQLTRESKERFYDRVLFVSGVFAGESKRRAELHDTEVDRVGARVHVSPLLDWTGHDIATYRRKYNLKQNPISKKYGHSGECLCGYAAGPGTLEQIRDINPEVADYIEQVEEKAPYRCGYEDDGPSDLERQEEAGQMTLCNSCTF